MKIEIAESGKMTQSGQSLLRLIQNEKTPNLDLFVREAVQNSLDAMRRDPVTKLPNVDTVNVSFWDGEFSCQSLCPHLEGISQGLQNRYADNDTQHYLAIGDQNTMGLGGEADCSKVSEVDYGNWIKLVYQICQPQQNAGAGGSWGIGKTVYFRLGIGLVLYYSRFMKENGEYESRLAATLVEDQDRKDALIPPYGLSKRGIAWWGRRAIDANGNEIPNQTLPVIDDAEIANVLSIFHLTPYKDNETGTIVVIPFISPDSLLKHNRADADDAEEEETSHVELPWYQKNKIGEYLRIAVQRWYGLRLNLMQTENLFVLPKLAVRINNAPITLSAMEPIFRAYHDLYRHAFLDDVHNDFFTNTKNVEVVKKHVTIEAKTTWLQKTNTNVGVAGTLIFAKLTRAELGMCPPDNYLSPMAYCLGKNDANQTKHKPLIAYTRKPGMIVAYELDGKWVSGISDTNNNEYIIGLFVLNTEAAIRNYPPTAYPQISNLEEYVRKSEMADHTSWSDWTKDDFKPQYVSKIQKNVVKLISETYNQKPETSQPVEKTSLSGDMANWVLPSQGFGNNVTPPAPPQPPKHSVKHATISVGDKTFSNQEMHVNVKLTNIKSSCKIELGNSFHQLCWSPSLPDGGLGNGGHILSSRCAFRRMFALQTYVEKCSPALFNR